MSAITHVLGAGWAGTHRALALLVAMVLVAVAVTVAVVLLTRSTTAAVPGPAHLPAYDDTCANATVGAAC
ncbi:hypothetical protein [Modestobacter altitudinis]|uniref:hypothetical protein n=1 Tax=Modestobacter altitudinis TaxID=2213158 RepID=UPI00110C93B7|nr:hypothetical protein [Modestobacter altitudinis]